jgi:hypothetical protein
MDCVGCWANTPQVRSFGPDGKGYTGDDVVASSDGGTFPEALARATARLGAP